MDLLLANNWVFYLSAAKINEGQRMSIYKITFTGNKSFDEEKFFSHFGDMQQFSPA